MPTLSTSSATALILNGRLASKHLRVQLKAQAEALAQDSNRRPSLAVVQVGEDPASSIYVRNKNKACHEVGILAETFVLPTETEEDALLDLITALNDNSKIDGILVQLPLPRHINTQNILRHINPTKDVDGFHPLNRGLLEIGDPKALVACTPSGIMRLLAHYNCPLAGKTALVVGRSNIVGRPLLRLLEQADATVIQAHSKTQNLPALTQLADILIVAAGRPNLIEAHHIKEGAVVIDVGINRLEDGTLIGDVQFESVCERAAAISPVPGGVGPMTITALLANCLQAAAQQRP